MKFVVLCVCGWGGVCLFFVFVGVFFAAVVKILLEDRPTLEEVSFPSPEEELKFPCWLDEGLQRPKCGRPSLGSERTEAEAAHCSTTVCVHMLLHTESFKKKKKRS